MSFFKRPKPLPKKIAFVQVVPQEEGPRLGLYQKGGGLYSSSHYAREQARSLQNKGFTVKYYEAETIWREIPVADPVTIDEHPV